MSAPLVRHHHVENLEMRLSKFTDMDSYKKNLAEMKQQVQEANPGLVPFFDEIGYGESPVRYFCYDLLEQAARGELPVIEDEVYDAVRHDFFSDSHTGNDQLITMELGNRIRNLNPFYSDFVTQRFFMFGGNPEFTSEDKGAAAVVSMNDGVVVYNLVDRQLRKEYLQEPCQKDMPIFLPKHIKHVDKMVGQLLPSNPDFRMTVAEIDHPLHSNDTPLTELCRELAGVESAVNGSYAYYLIWLASHNRIPVTDKDVRDSLREKYNFANGGLENARTRLSELGDEDPAFAYYVTKEVSGLRKLKKMIPDMPVSPDGALIAYIMVYDAVSKQMEKERKK